MHFIKHNATTTANARGALADVRVVAEARPDPAVVVVAAAVAAAAVVVVAAVAVTAVTVAV